MLRTKIVLAATNWTVIASEESFNGQPLATFKDCRSEIRNLGRLSFVHGWYNKFQDDGLALDVRRRVDVLAADWQQTFSKPAPIKCWSRNGIRWCAWNVFAAIRTQTGWWFCWYCSTYHSRQYFGFERSVINAAYRLEYVDWMLMRSARPVPTFAKILKYSDGLAWSTTQQTVIRLNYRYNWQNRFAFGNPATKTAGFQFDSLLFLTFCRFFTWIFRQRTFTPPPSNL